ncbi:hypothetical protein CHS0354_040339 [Potamilus streckersoni]|uniref:Ankyrin repeat protein n=1 Tax=Potamilus streckersoni TaxID=2493646 RepID=A0AAE0S159_9BIVA|nr:hypothetical protein CHS0354_040339 [Potamilus streckersoni]
MFNNNVVDISAEPHCLTKAEREQMLKKYVPQIVDRKENYATKDIVEMENVIGFAQNCKIAGSIPNIPVDLKEIFSNNMFLTEEMKDMSKKIPESYTFLVLLMLSGGSLSLQSKQKELNNKIKALSDDCGLKKLTISKMKDIGHSLCGTLLEYIEQRETFKFQHDCTETAVFVSFGMDYPDKILEHCSLKQLSKMCCVANERDRPDDEKFLSFKIKICFDHFRIMCDIFNEGLESGGRDSFKSIAEGIVWKSQRFVDHISDTMALGDNVLNFLSKTDPDGHSLLIHLVNAKSTLAVKGIIKNIFRCCLQDNDSAARQLLLATTNTCLTEDKTMFDEFVMLAAASTGNVSVMETLVLQGGNINATISTKQKNANDLSNDIKNYISHPRISWYHHDINLFHIACRYGLTDMVRYLMNNFPELVQRTSNLGRTAVHFLACAENLELMKALCDAQIDIKDAINQSPNHSRLDISARDNDGTNVLHIAARNDNLPLLKYLIENNPSLTLQNDKNGWTAIHYAAARGSAPVIEALIQAGLDLNARTSYGAHVLHIAAMHDNLSIVKYLIENDPSLPLQNDKNGWTAIQYAAAGGSAPVIEALIQAGLDLNTKTNDNNHVLHIVAHHDNLSIIKHLIENNPSLPLQNDKNGWTAIHYAAAGGSAPVIEALIQAGLDLNARTNDNKNVLHIAAHHDNLSIIKYLMENNPSLALQNDKNGWTAIHYAAARGSAPVIEALIQAGLDLNARTNDNKHVLHIAAHHDNLSIIKHLIENNPSLALQNDKNGWTAIHYAAAGGSAPVIESLIQAGLDLNARTSYGAHVLHIAAHHDNLSIIKHLMENNPSLALQNDKNGWTAIHYAAARGSAPVIEALIQAELDLNARTNDNKHVLHIAAHHDNLSIIKHLVENNPSLPLQNDKNGWTSYGAHVLHIAAHHDNLSIIKHLMENNPSLTLQNDKNGWTAIHYAAARGSAPVIEALIQAGLDLNARTNDNKHVLHIAAHHDNLSIIKHLIENYPSLPLQNDKNGWTAIHYAAAGGSAPVIEALIQAGLDLNARTNDNKHVLHIAAHHDNLSIIKHLIENNPSLSLQNDKNGWTAIHYAAAGGSAPVIEALIQAGLDLNARTSYGAHVLHIAAHHDNLWIVKYLIENNPSLTLQNDKNGWTAIHYAAAGGSAPVIEALIQAELDLNARTNDNKHVLHITAHHDNLSIIEHLIENNPSLPLQNDKNGWTAIHYAAARGSAPVIEALKQAGLDLNARTSYGAHVLHIAAHHDNLWIVKYLIENNPSLTLQNDKNGWTAIHYAAAGGSAPVIEALIQAGLDLNTRTNDDNHVMHVAAENDNLPIVKYLIVNNPSLPLQNDKKGWTAIHYAAMGGSAPVIESLIQAGLDLNARTNDDNHVLHIAVLSDNLPIVKYLIENNPSLPLQNDKKGWTAIHYAAMGGSAPVIEALIQAGLDLNARTNDDNHVLHIAVLSDNLPIVKYLIENNPSLTLQNDKNGWTAIHYAAAGGSAPAIEALIQAGLDLNARTNDDKHVLHIAAENDNLPIVKYLIENNPSLTLQKDMDGWTAIHYAAKGGSAPVIEALMQTGLDINSRTNEDAHVLHIAAENDNITIVKYLIENNPSLTLQNDKDRWTAIHYAAKGGCAPVMEALKQAGLDINSRTNVGAHVLHIAARNNNLMIVIYLIDINLPVMMQSDNDGRTAIHYAAEGGSVPVMETLIQAGLNINARTNNGANVLHIAAGNDNLPIIEYVIIMNPPMILEKDNDGWTALDYADQGDSSLVLETLIQAQVELMH